MGLFNPKQMLINELKKVDIDHDGRPDVVEALDAVEAGCLALAKLTERFDAHDYSLLLHALNNVAGKKLSDAEIVEGSKALAALPAGLKSLNAILEGAEKELK